jgi:hypothetical protein
MPLEKALERIAEVHCCDASPGLWRQVTGLLREDG